MEIGLICSVDNEGSLSDISEYQKAMDDLVDGEEDEWLYSISKPPPKEKKPIIFSWLTSQLAQPGKVKGTKSEDATCLNASSSQDAISIGSLYDLETMTDLKLFGVTSEQVKNYGPADVGIYDGFTIEELLKPLEFESKALEIPTGVQNCLDGFLKKIENKETNGFSSLAKFAPHKESHPSARSSIIGSSKYVPEASRQVTSSPLTKNTSSPSPGSILSQRPVVQRGLSLLSKSTNIGTKADCPMKAPQKGKVPSYSSSALSHSSSIKSPRSVLYSPSSDLKSGPSALSPRSMEATEYFKRTAQVDKLFPSRIPRPPVRRTSGNPGNMTNVKSPSNLIGSSRSKEDVAGYSSSHSLASQSITEIYTTKKLSHKPSLGLKEHSFISRIPRLASQKSVDKLASKYQRFSSVN